MDKFDLKKYLAEGKLLNEFIGGELEKRNEVLYDKLVPGSGAAGTIEGEMLRAMNRLIYRYYNDGDKFFEGYGTETAGPAHSYLVNSKSAISADLDRIFSKIVHSNDHDYKQGIDAALALILDYVEKHEAEGYSEPNKEDMFDYESEFKNEEEDDDWDDYHGGYGYEDEDEDEDIYENELNENSYERISKPRFIKDKNNPNFLNVYIDYDLGPGGSSIALGKETMTGQIRRLSAAKAMEEMQKIASELESKYNIEDIEVIDLENGKVQLFAVSDDFIDMDFKN